MIESSRVEPPRPKAVRNPPLAYLWKEHRMLKLIKRFRREEEGAALAEYGMLVGLIAVICVAAVTLLGTDVSGAFRAIAVALSAICDGSAFAVGRGAATRGPRQRPGLPR